VTQNRRTFLALAAGIAVAGCTESFDGQTESGGNDGSTEPEPESEPEAETRPEDDAAEESTDELLFDFQDIDEWEAVAGTVSPDREEYVTGDASARLDGSTDPVIRFERTGLDLDLTEQRPSIVARCHSQNLSEAVDVIAYDIAGNMMRFRTRFFKTGEETTFMPLDMGINDWDEGVDLSAIETLRIQIRFGATSSGILWVDSVYLTPVPETPALMIQWDDGYASQYTEALPIQREYDIPSTTFLNTDNIGDGGRLSLEQLTELQNAGWEIGSHLRTHENLRDLTRREQEVQIRGSKEWLIENGFETGSEFVSYPFGTYDQSGYELVEEQYTYAMVGGEPGYGLPRNPAHVGRSSERTLGGARAYIDTLVQWGGIGGLFWHELPRETPLAEFEQIMQYIADRRDAGELDVITLSDLAALQGR
jgi:peptidoglycan/xylan/chitin deacetylase (PgdA/CDA1 family)